MTLQGKIAFVTGGGRAIGKAISLQLACDGADLMVFGPDQQELEETAAQIRQLGPRALAVKGDVRNEDQVGNAVAAANQSLGPIDILVNNAGIIGPTALVRDIVLDEWNEVLAVNLTGALICSKAVARHMMNRRAGKIINIASVAGKLAYPFRSPYAVSKWGLIGLTLTLAKELGPYNIQVNAVCPGPVEGQRMQTIIERRAVELGQSTEQVFDAYVEATALQRMVRQEDVAALVAFLACAAADNLTGQAIDVSAGYAI